MSLGELVRFVVEIPMIFLVYVLGGLLASRPVRDVLFSSGQQKCRTNRLRIYRFLIPDFSQKHAPNIVQDFRGLVVLCELGKGWRRPPGVTLESRSAVPKLFGIQGTRASKIHHRPRAILSEKSPRP